MYYTDGMYMYVLDTSNESTVMPHSIPCQHEVRYCLNGGTCYHFESLDRDYCV